MTCEPLTSRNIDYRLSIKLRVPPINQVEEFSRGLYNLMYVLYLGVRNYFPGVIDSQHKQNITRLFCTTEIQEPPLCRAAHTYQ